MKLLILLSIVGVAVGRPSYGHQLLYSPDGRSFSYSYDTPLVQSVVHGYHGVPIAQPASVVVGPALRYSYAAVPVAVKQVEPSHIQVSSDGFVLDTREVAEARAEHLAAFAREAAKAGASEESEPIVVPENDAVEISAPTAGETRTDFEEANIQLSADGSVVDTPEVAKARAEHLARFAAEAARSVHSVSYAVPNYFAYNYIQPVAAPALKAVEVADIKVSADGHVLDTPEVAQAKAEHFAQFASDAARAAAAGDDESDDSSIREDAGESVEAEAPAPAIAAKADDPPADIRVSADGFVLDTPEVAQAKSAHLAELAKSGGDSESNDDSESVVSYAVPTFPAYTSPAVAYTGTSLVYAQPKYAGPEADIRVNAEGFVEDTPEVQHARAEHLATRASVLAQSGVQRYAAAVQAGPEAQLVYGGPHLGYSFVAPSYRLLAFRYAPAATALLQPGHYLQDTPEVAAAKLQHAAAHAKARGL